MGLAHPDHKLAKIWIARAKSHCRFNVWYRLRGTPAPNHGPAQRIMGLGKARIETNRVLQFDDCAFAVALQIERAAQRQMRESI